MAQWEWQAINMLLGRHAFSSGRQAATLTHHRQQSLKLGNNATADQLAAMSRCKAWQLCNLPLKDILQPDRYGKSCTPFNNAANSQLTMTTPLFGTTTQNLRGHNYDSIICRHHAHCGRARMPLVRAPAAQRLKTFERRLQVVRKPFSVPRAQCPQSHALRPP